MTPLAMAEVEIEAAFHDVDAMDVVWHGHYLKYFEQARCALLRGIGYDYPQMRDSGYLWPVVECQLKYLRPVRYGQRIRVTAQLGEYENRLRILYTVRDAGDGQVLTRGHSVQVAVDAASGELQFVSPPVLLRKLGVAT